MSKSWAPAPDGQPIHSTKIRIVGAEPDTPEYNEVLNRLHGQISQFIRAQHQRAQLSGLDQHKASSTRDGVTMTYHNNYGQDMITVEVHTPGLKAEKQETIKMDYLSWALIEFEIDGVVSAGTDFDAYAELTATIGGQKIWAERNGGQSSSDLILRFAEWGVGNGFGRDDPAYNLTIPEDFSRGSLLVDLRKFANPGSVAIDVYMQVDADPISGYPGFIGQPMTTITAILLAENPFDAVSQIVATDPHPPTTGGCQDFFVQWEDSKIYPNRHKMGEAPFQLPVPIGLFPSGGAGSNPDNHFNMPKVGTVTLTPSTTGAGFNLKAA